MIGGINTTIGRKTRSLDWCFAPLVWHTTWPIHATLYSTIVAGWVGTAHAAWHH
jgi:hypothetical protein